MEGNINNFLKPSNSKGFYVGLKTWIRKSYTPLTLVGPLSKAFWRAGRPMEARTPLLPQYARRGLIKRGLPSYHDRWMGIHAWSTLQVDSLCSDMDNVDLFRGYTTGFVAMWGEVAVHECGFRSQFAYPIALMDSEAAESFGADFIELQLDDPRESFFILREYLCTLKCRKIMLNDFNLMCSLNHPDSAFARITISTRC